MVAGIEHVQNQGSGCVLLLRRGCGGHSPAIPTPSTHTTVKGVQVGLCRRSSQRRDRDVAGAFTLGPAFGCKLFIDFSLDSLLPERIRDVDLEPVVAVVFGEVISLVVISRDLLSKCDG